MTVCGFRIAAGGAFALAWADGEIYRDDAVVGELTKLARSPAGLVGIATGFADLARQWRGMVKALGYASFDSAVAALPAQLRAARAVKVQHARDHGYAIDVATTYALSGCSYGHLRGAVFYERRNFEPTEADAWLSPYIDAEPETADAVLAVAQRQLTYVQRECPGATGGMLSIARIGANKTITVQVPLLLAHEGRAA